MEGYIGEIRGFAGSFAPQNWAFCEGQSMTVNQYQALYAILGNIYGGNQTAFNLPDLRGRIPVGAGQAPGLSNYQQGIYSGAESIGLTINNLPIHNHLATAALTLSGTAAGNVSMKCCTESGDQASAVGNSPASINEGYVAPSDATGSMAPFAASLPVTGTVGGTVTVGNSGGSIPFSIVQPVLTIRWIICINGIFPTRN
jgi:microcystin-dependent protein